MGPDKSTCFLNCEQQCRQQRELRSTASFTFLSSVLLHFGGRASPSEIYRFLSSLFRIRIAKRAWAHVLINLLSIFLIHGSFFRRALLIVHHRAHLRHLRSSKEIELQLIPNRYSHRCVSQRTLQAFSTLLILFQ